jgi:hypothetical protein
MTSFVSSLSTLTPPPHPSTVSTNNGKQHEPDQRAPEWLNWFREAELKHGRQAMLATVGLIVPEFVRVPGEQFSFEAIPNVLDAHDALLDSSMKQILLWVSFAEACSLAALSNMNEYDREPGNFDFDPLGLYPKDEAGRKAMKLKELKNGRLVRGNCFSLPSLIIFVVSPLLSQISSTLPSFIPPRV